MSFRSLLLALVLGLLVVTTTATSFFAFNGTRQATTKLVRSQIATTLEGINRQIEALFDPAERILKSLRREILEDAIPWQDPLATANYFAILLRYEQGIAWVGFGRADGSFAGAWTDGARIVLNISSPDSGRPSEWELAEDGTLQPIQRPEVPDHYDARQRDWFQLAVDADGMVWSPPYDFASGGRGISACLAVRDRDGALLGVLTVDFTLSDIAAYLEKLARDYSSEALVFSLNGELLATPEREPSAIGLDAIQELLADLSQEETRELEEEQLIRAVHLHDDTVLIGMRAAAVAGNLDCISTVIASKRKNFGWLDQLMRNTWLAAAAALLVSLLLGFLLAGRVADPLRQIAGSLSKIGQFDLDGAPPPKSNIREIRSLLESVGKMRNSLRSFARYVPVELVRELVRTGHSAEPGGERREVTILFCDLAGFTAFAETVSPEVSVEKLTAYFEEVGHAVESHGGIIDKFLGDGIMALFNAPGELPNHQAAACHAALDAVGRLRPDLPGNLGVRFGIHTGHALLGNVGTAKRFAYTAIGDSVNLASRIENLGKVYRVPVLTSGLVRQTAADREFLWRLLDRVAVPGREEPLEVFQLIGRGARVDPKLMQMVEDYENALRAAWDGRFDAASALLAPHTADPPSRLLASRMARLAATPGAEKWDGIFRPPKN